ncbi:S-layer homology domain-containing protein [Paenibacillus xylanexedens]|nr:S-layer homology domain-containing protein [Paenibacillus xylanexedens]
MVLMSDGTVVGWGNNGYGQLHLPVGVSEVVAIDVGSLHTLALKPDGTVVAWGHNYNGQVNVPVGLNGVVSIATGGVYSLALKSDGTVVAWGNNAHGQTNVPADLDGVVGIAAGDIHSLALKSDGTVVAWGNNTHGQTNVPAGLDGVVGIAAGTDYSLALKSDGTVAAWGYNNVNNYGQTNVPAGLDGVVAIAVGLYHSLALKSDGTVVVWGYNQNGQANVPVGLDGVVAIAAGAQHSLALKSDGTVVAWGYNQNGQTNVPGNARLSDLKLQEGDFIESFDPSVTAYTYYYDGQSLSSVDVTPTLASTNQTVMYVNDELLPSGSTKTINFAGATTDTVILVRVEPYLLPGQTYNITLAIDSTAPEVQFGTNGRAVAAKTAASIVTVSDLQSGVDETLLEYLWTQSTTVPISGWSPFSDGDTLSQTSGDGNWYLHIRATDNVGNVTDAISNPFLLDNTAPTVTVSSSASGTVNNAFPVRISFNEGVTDFTEDELVVVNGIVSDFVAENATTYTATITPITSGQAVTVAVDAAAATDKAGLENTVSNTLSLLYDTTKPVVTFDGFMDHQQFASPPTEISVSVSELVYWIADDAPLITANALPLISMEMDGNVFSAYTPSYDEFSRTFTLTFNKALEDGEYRVLVAGNVVENENHNILEAANVSFIVAVPTVTNLAASPNSLPHTGGDAAVILTGTNLTGQTVRIYVDGAPEGAAATVISDKSATATVTFPHNSARTDRSYRLTSDLNGGEVAGQSTTVTVNAAPAPTSPIDQGGSSAAPPAVTPSPSNQAALAKINVYNSGKALELSPNFTSGTMDYTVETDAEQVELEVTSVHSKAVVKLRGERIGEVTTVPLAMGANVLTLTVQAEDGTINTYIVTVTRITDDENNVPSAPVCRFTDIENHWATSEICEAAELGIVEGIDAYTFVPRGNVTRTEFTVMLMRTLQIPIRNESSEVSFSDAESIPAWAHLAIQTAVAEGILQGYPDGTLRPRQTVSRAEMATMLSKAMKWNADRTASSYFSDNTSIPTWAKAYVEAAQEHGLLKGQAGNRFVPEGRTSRAEAAVVLLRLWKSIH